MIQLIAETAWHHEGDYNFMNHLIHSIIEKTKVDYIKLHITLDPDNYYHTDFPTYHSFDKRSLKKKEWEKLINIVNESNKKPFFLVNDPKAVDFCLSYDPELVEVHSVTLNDINLLHALRSNITKETKVVLGVGGCTLNEIEHAINEIKTDNIVLMFGFQNYPTKYEDINFRKVQKIMKLYPKYEYGYADHSAWDEPNNILITLFGAAMGMSYVEKHVTTEYGKQRTDWNSSISIGMINELYEKLKILSDCNGTGFLELNEAEKKYSIYGPMKKAAIVNRNLLSTQILQKEDFSFKRTKQISDLSQLDVINLIGKTLSADVAKGNVLYKKYFD